jgi:predicted nucleotidyltransferase
VVAAYARWLRERFRGRVRHVWLFGSYARGDAHEGSDVDVAATVDELTWSEKVEAVGKGAEVSLAHGMHLSPVVMSTADFERLVALESAFAGDILGEGIAA